MRRDRYLVPDREVFYALGRGRIAVSDPAVTGLIESAQEHGGWIMSRTWFDLLDNPDDLDEWRADHLRGYAIAQRWCWDRGLRCELLLPYRTDVAKGGGRPPDPETARLFEAAGVPMGTHTWNPDFDWGLLMLAYPDDLDARLASFGEHQRGEPLMASGTRQAAWAMALLQAQQRGGRPIAYHGNASVPLWQVLAVLLDPTAPGYEEAIVEHLWRLRQSIARDYGAVVSWELHAKDKHYTYDPERWPDTDGWYWPPTWGRVEEWPAAIRDDDPAAGGDPHRISSGLFATPWPYRELSNREVRTRLHKAVADAGVPAVTRLWVRPSDMGVTYEDYLLRGEGDRNLGWTT